MLQMHIYIIIYKISISDSSENALNKAQSIAYFAQKSSYISNSLVVLTVFFLLYIAYSSRFQLRKILNRTYFIACVFSFSG